MAYSDINKSPHPFMTTPRYEQAHARPARPAPAPVPEPTMMDIALSNRMVGERRVREDAFLQPDGQSRTKWLLETEAAKNDKWLKHGRSQGVSPIPNHLRRWERGMDLIMSCENAEPSHAEPDLAFDTTIGFETTTKVASSPVTQYWTGDAFGRSMAPEYSRHGQVWNKSMAL